MKNKLIKKIIGVTLGCMMLCSGVVVSARDTGTSSNPGYIYYRSNGNLFKAAADGSGSIEIAPNYDSYKMIPAKGYVYYFASQNSTTLLRIANDGSQKMGKRFADDVVNVFADDNNIYYMTDEGKIYAAPSDCADASAAKEIADMADKSLNWFTVVDGVVYYDALKDGRTDWLTAVSVTGNGDKKWIAKGAVYGNSLITKDSSNIYMMVNTKPESQYSTKSVVMYSIKRGDETGKAVNAKKPIDVNAVLSGTWVNGSYIYNDGIKKDYSTGKGYAITIKGKVTSLYSKAIVEAANVGSNKIAFVDNSYNAYVDTIKNGKVSSRKKLSIKLAPYVRNLGGQGDKDKATFFTASGVYSVDSSLKTKKLTGTGWKECWYDRYDDNSQVPGFFYLNAADNDKLYYVSSDGKTNSKVSDDKVTNTEDIDGVYYISQY